MVTRNASNVSLSVQIRSSAMKPTYNAKELAILYQELLDKTDNAPHPIQILELAKLAGGIIDVGTLDGDLHLRVLAVTRYRELGAPSFIGTWHQDTYDAMLKIYPKERVVYKRESNFDEYVPLVDIDTKGLRLFLVLTSLNVMVLCGYS